MVRICFVVLVACVALIVFEFSVFATLRADSLLFRALPSLVPFAGLMATVFFALSANDLLVKYLRQFAQFLANRKIILLATTTVSALATIGFGEYVRELSYEKDGIFVVQVVHKADVANQVIPDIPIELDQKLKKEQLNQRTDADGKAYFNVNLTDTFAVRVRQSSQPDAPVAVLGDSKLKIDDKTKSNFLLVKFDELEGAWIKTNAADAWIDKKNLAYAQIPETYFRWQQNSGPPSNINVDSDPLTVPFDLPSSEVILRRKAFLVGFSPRLRLARWVAYKIIPGPRLQRENSPWIADPALPASYQATSNDYKASGYDRGGLVSRRDLFGLGAAEVNKLFNLTVIVPQLAFVNRRSWLLLEEYTSRKADNGAEVFVVRGPIFAVGDGRSLGTTLLGANAIPVPTHFFQVTVDTGKTPWKVEAYVMPNAYVATMTSNSESLQLFRTSVKRIEAMTGLTFDSQISR